MPVAETRRASCHREEPTNEPAEPCPEQVFGLIYPDDEVYAKMYPRMWSDSVVNELSTDAFWLYWHLNSFNRSKAGVADWRPKRAARHSGSCNTEAKVRAAADELQLAGLVLFDEDTEEAFIRSHARNDKVLNRGGMGKNVLKAYWNVHSEQLRAMIVFELKRLREDDPNRAAWQDLRTLLDTADALDPLAYVSLWRAGRKDLDDAEPLPDDPEESGFRGGWANAGGF